MREALQKDVQNNTYMGLRKCRVVDSQIHLYIFRSHRRKHLHTLRCISLKKGQKPTRSEAFNKTILPENWELIKVKSCVYMWILHRK